MTVAALALAGCGAESADLFEVRRSGADPNANVGIVVSDGGTVRCNRGEARALQGSQLLDARELARDLERQASLAIELPPQDNSILRYVVRTSAGRVAFSDTSAGRPQAFDEVAAFSSEVIEDVCGIERN